MLEVLTVREVARADVRQTQIGKTANRELRENFALLHNDSTLACSSEARCREDDGFTPSRSSMVSTAIALRRL